MLLTVIIIWFCNYHYRSCHRAPRGCPLSRIMTVMVIMMTMTIRTCTDSTTYIFTTTTAITTTSTANNDNDNDIINEHHDGDDDVVDEDEDDDNTSPAVAARRAGRPPSRSHGGLAPPVARLGSYVCMCIHKCIYIYREREREISDP